MHIPDIAQHRRSCDGRPIRTGAPRLPLSFLLCSLGVTCLAGAADVATVAAGTTLKIAPPPSGVSSTELKFSPVFSDFRYTVETAPDLTAGTWTPLAANTITANGSTWTCIDPQGTNSRKFYRVSVSAQDAKGLAISDEQPRLFWNGNDGKIAGNIAAKPDDRRLFFGNVRKTRMVSLPKDSDPFSQVTITPGLLAAITAEMQTSVASNTSGEFFRPAMDYGLCAFLSRNTDYAPVYRAYAEEYLAALCARGLPCDPDADDLGPREALYAMGVLYDWLGLDSSTTLGTTVHKQTLNLIGAIDKVWGYFSQPDDSGGHGRYANECALAALLAVRHGIEHDPKADCDAYYKWLALVVRNWRERFNPTQAWMSGDSGHGMGWAYGPEYTTAEPGIMWDNATEEERWTGDWLRERALFQVYGARNRANEETTRNQAKDENAPHVHVGYETFPYSGDVFSTTFTILNHSAHLLIGNSPAAGWLYQQLTANKHYQYRYNYWPHLLYYDPSVTPPLTKELDLPLARSFGVSGYVLMRDSWDLDKNTLLEFKSSSYHHSNHHHRDQNAFTLFFRGPLAIDSGAYQIFGNGDYGSAHELNYYRRSIAHNTILVYDPDETFGTDEKPLANDGGQALATEDKQLLAEGARAAYPTLAQMQPGGTNALDGILAFENRADFAYALGDATKAYSPAKLSDFRRSIVYLRNFAGTHPVVVVHDRVVATNPRFKKTYLLHSVNEPVIDNKLRRVTITIDDATTAKLPSSLIQETVLPTKATITKVGGPDKAFWVDDDGTGPGHGKNYNEHQRTGHDDCVALREAGQWRVEVTPSESEARAADSFLHVLTVTESSTAAPAVVTSVTSTPDDDSVIVQSPGAQGSGTCLLFHHSGKPLDITLDLSSTARLIAVGLPGGTTVSRSWTGTTLHLYANAGGSLRASDQGVLVVDAP